MNQPVPQHIEQLANRIVSLHQSEGQSTEAAIDKDYLLEHIDLYMLYYFPQRYFCAARGTTQWEPLNDLFFNFIETHSRGVIIFPGAHGKTTMLGCYPIWVWSHAPSNAIIYTEKTQPMAVMRGGALQTELTTNRKLIKHYGPWRPEPSSSRQWSTGAFSIRQRIIEHQTPSFVTLPIMGSSSLGLRCNILLNDDPVIPENSESEADRAKLLAQYNKIARTSPSPLECEDMRFALKHFLIGTIFREDDLYMKAMEDPRYEVLRLQAVDLATVESGSSECPTLSPWRFIYIDPEELKLKAEVDPLYQHMQELVEKELVENLYAFRFGTEGGQAAFFQRYQNEPLDPARQKFKPICFEGGYDPETGIEYPGCWDAGHSLERREPGWLAQVALDPQSGKRTKVSARAGFVTLGADPAKPEDIYLIDVDWGQMPQQSANPQTRTQMSLFVTWCDKYGARGTIEDNACQYGLQGAAQVEAQRRKVSISVRPFGTYGNKNDPEIGIDGLVPLVESGHLHLPTDAYGRPERKAQELVAQMTRYGVYPYSDVLMAFWMGVVALKARLKLFRHETKRRSTPERAYVNRLEDFRFPGGWTGDDIQRYLARRGWRGEEILMYLQEKGLPLPEEPLMEEEVVA